MTDMREKIARILMDHQLGTGTYDNDSIWQGADSEKEQMRQLADALIAALPELHGAPAGHLWEADHPYYMNEGSFYESGCHQTFECLDDFLAEWAEADIDMNRVHRWDWREGDDWGVSVDGSDDVIGNLKIYFIMQRKARTFSCEIAVRRSDEDRVIEYLRPHAAQEAAVWAPMLPAAPSAAGGEGE